MDLDNLFDAFDPEEKDVEVLTNTHIRFDDSSDAADDADEKDDIVEVDKNGEALGEGDLKKVGNDIEVEVVLDDDNDEDANAASTSKNTSKLAGLEDIQDLLMEDSDDDIQEEPKIQFFSSFSKSQLSFEKDDNASNKVADQNSKSKGKSSSACFNCGEGHSVGECPMPKDQGRIRRNREKMMGKKNNDKSSKFSDKTVGNLSADLRKALGLDDRELPPWIYRMRQLGYPPGYLHTALNKEENKHTLSMVDVVGEAVDINGTTAVIEINADRIMRYPGFNVPVPEGVYDEHQRMPDRIPRIRREHSVDDMVQKLNDGFAHVQRQETRKRTMQDGDGSGENKRRREEDDMDIEDGDDEIQILPPPPMPPPPPPVIPLENEEEDQPRSPSPDAYREPVSTADIPLEGGNDDVQNTPSTSRRNFSLVSAPGTPLGVGLRSKTGGTPNLNKFAEGIVPFEAAEEYPSTKGGILDSLTDLLKHNEEYQKDKAQQKEEEAEEKEKEKKN